MRVSPRFGILVTGRWQRFGASLTADDDLLRWPEWSSPDKRESLRAAVGLPAHLPGRLIHEPNTRTTIGVNRAGSAEIEGAGSVFAGGKVAEPTTLGALPAGWLAVMLSRGGDVFGSFARVVLVLRLTAPGSASAWPARWATASPQTGAKVHATHRAGRDRSAGGRRCGPCSRAHRHDADRPNAGADPRRIRCLTWRSRGRI